MAAGFENVLPPEVTFQSSTEGGQPGPGEVVWDLGKRIVDLIPHLGLIVTREPPMPNVPHV